LDELARTEHDPSDAMRRFADWLSSLARGNGNPVFVGFNARFDWSFVNDYFHRCGDGNPFAFTALDIKALYMPAATGPTPGRAKSPKT
jgi:ribonuclease T